MPEARQYVVVVERSGDGWIAEVEGVRVRAHARTLRSLEDRVREAMHAARFYGAALWFRWPKGIVDLVTSVEHARDLAAHLQEAAQQEMLYAARKLKGLGLSQRDTAHLLGVSFQRVQQLLGSS